MAKKPRVFDPQFKLKAAQRMLAGESPMQLSRELSVLRKDLYLWRDRLRTGGPDALRGKGRPPKPKGMPRPPAAGPLEAARRRILELERTVGQQQMDVDFFRAALRQVEATRRAMGLPGVTGSTRSSKK
jgi:transposase